VYGYEASFLTLREDDRLRVFVNRTSKGIFGPRYRKYKEAEGKCIMRRFIIYTFHQILFQLQNMKRTDNKEDTDGRVILKWILMK
jgi:hypothetical protein